jgi:hypothetical protein
MAGYPTRFAEGRFSCVNLEVRSASFGASLAAAVPHVSAIRHRHPDYRSRPSPAGSEAAQSHQSPFGSSPRMAAGLSLQELRGASWRLAASPRPGGSATIVAGNSATAMQPPAAGANGHLRIAGYFPGEPASFSVRRPAPRRDARHAAIVRLCCFFLVLGDSAGRRQKFTR